MNQQRNVRSEEHTVEPEGITGTSFGSAARAVALGVAALFTSSGEVGASSPTEPNPIVAPSLSPRAATNLLMERRLTIETPKLPLEQLLAAVTSMSEVRIETLWETANDPKGLPKELEIPLSIKNRTVRDVLEKIAEALEREGFSSTWQVLEDGRLQFGAKESLNRFQERRVIDPRDIVKETPIFDGAPEFNLNGALTQGQGGSGGGSIIGDPRESSTPRRTSSAGLERLKEIIIETIEPEQWTDAGGSGGSIRIYNDKLFVRAAPYILRKL